MKYFDMYLTLVFMSKIKEEKKGRIYKCVQALCKYLSDKPGNCCGQKLEKVDSQARQKADGSSCC